LKTQTQHELHQQAIAKAERFVGQTLRGAKDDPHRLAYHVSPPVQWMNDPNGLIHYNGEYHLFYQYNPYSQQWGDIHWAHVKSSDLVRWERLPIALAPSESYDVNGCFSGSAVEHDGKLYLFYTANIFTTPVGIPDDLIQQQCVAVSEDGGMTFEKLPNNPVIPAPPAHIGQTNHFRDPKVWQHEGTWYMVLGAKKDGRGKVLVYTSQDLLTWEYRNVLTESDGTMGYMHECPDLFPLGGQDVLLISPEGVEAPRLSGYYVGQFDHDACQYAHGPFRKLDYGFDFYAPQTFLDAKGRRILFGWMPMDGKALGKDWAGSMTLPRELSLTEDGRLRMQPVEELQSLRGRHIASGELTVADGELRSVPGIEGECVELIVAFDLAKSDARELGLRVRSSADGSEYTAIRFDLAAKTLSFDRTRSGAGEAGVKSCTVEHLSGDGDTLTLRVFLDRSTVELFANEGDYVMSGFVFPKPDSRGIQLYAAGGAAVVRGMEFWELEDVSASLRASI